MDDADSPLWLLTTHLALSACLLLIAEQIGASLHVVNSAIEYTKIREQFGRPIGSFQAVKHKVVDMAVDAELMMSAGWEAVTSASASAETGTATTALHLAKAFCSEAAFRIAADHIQILGGIGFTWEHSAHLYFRRAKTSEFVLGSPRWHRERLLESLANEMHCAATVR